MTRFALAAAALALTAASVQSADAPCRENTLQGRRVVVCTIDMARQSVRLLWKSQNGQPYGSLRGIGSAATAESGPMLFAMNAGMYHRDLSPVGLYVEGGVQHARANLSGGPGNFHMRPNGVFYIAGRTAGVMESRTFVNRAIKSDFATQSGPMLVLGGKLHPRITGGGTSAKIRNGVGVRDGRIAVFVITEEPVTFTEFARMFRDDLKTPNALYFDGSISSLYAPSVGRADSFMPVGPIVAGFAKAR